MNGHQNAVRNLVARRSKGRRCVYLLPLSVVLFFMLWAMHEGPLPLIMYVPLTVLIMVQYFRPTLLLWFLLLALFGAYTIAVYIRTGPPDVYYAVPFGLLPFVALLWAYPRPEHQVEG